MESPESISTSFAQEFVVVSLEQGKIASTNRFDIGAIKDMLPPSQTVMTKIMTYAETVLRCFPGSPGG